MAPRKSLPTAQPDGTPLRRSSRAPSLPPTPATPKTAVGRLKPRASAASTSKGTPRRASTPAKKKRKVEDVDEEDAGESEDGEDGAPASSKAGTKRKASELKAKSSRKVISGINSVPVPYAFDTSRFSFDVPTLAPAHELPRYVFVFGDGSFGQHGLGVDDESLTEIKRPRLHKWFADKIAEGNDWKAGAAALECGGMHSLAVGGGGNVWSWGINDNAALGRKTKVPGIESEELESQPLMVEGLGDDFEAVAIAASDSVSLAISGKGALRCWGSFRGSEGILGFDGREGSSLTQLEPVELPGLAAHTIVQVECGDDHFLALTSTGYVFACGNGEQNQLGRKIIQRHKTHGLTPERLALKNIVLVGAGSFHSFAVDRDGLVFGWGLNTFHQLGLAEEDGAFEETIATPTEITALHPSKHGGARVVQIKGGEHHTIFLLSNGSVYACGRCDGFEVGLASTHPAMEALAARKHDIKQQRVTFAEEERQRLEKEEPAASADEQRQKAEVTAAMTLPMPADCVPDPTLVTFPENVQIIDVASNARQCFACSSTGKLFAWGSGNVTQLSLGDDEEKFMTPRLLNGKDLLGFRVIKASTGGQHASVIAVRIAEAPAASNNGPASAPDVAG